MERCEGARLTARGAARAQGGYFVVNGSEKVLIAQERMANNHVYVFRKSQPGKYAVTAECRSVIEGSTRNTSSMSIKMLSRAAGRSGGQARAHRGAATGGRAAGLWLCGAPCRARAAMRAASRAHRHDRPGFFGIVSRGHMAV
jgi:hypothetical protein